MENYSDMEIGVLKSCLASAYLKERHSVEAIKGFDGLIEAHKIFIVLHVDRPSATISDCLLFVDMKEVQERFSCQNSR